MTKPDYTPSTTRIRAAGPASAREGFLTENWRRESPPYPRSRTSKAALDAGAFDKARRFATDVLKLAADRRDNLYGQVFHDGHVALGRVSLKNGKVPNFGANLTY